MIRGTTPEHIFTLPFDTASLKNVRVIYAQGGQKVFVKEGNACTLSGNTVRVRLTQADTLMFNHKKAVEIQIRALTYGGDALCSEIYSVTVGRCLDEEVLR